jgi:hypothetical protein
MTTLQQRTCAYKRKNKGRRYTRKPDFIKIGDLMPGLIKELENNIRRNKEEPQ